ncbi:hypothetical protein LMG23992_01868 [Cupriavidus laharis]|uniref:Uncharacterized protein n=1 Tax=Cupriavidus laharis TaxID=151654 RepID=A0ABM8WTU8_9BURK|nr:hypothetical protein [Cupriavidus laharis]CAG9170891.1 hypothetical protein LMG23992_01868 [Cupriavidus laharis]
MPTKRIASLGNWSKLEAERFAELPSHQRDARQAWRDQRLMQLMAHKRSASTGYASD